MGRGARKTLFDNRGAFGAYIARCVDLRYALPYGRVNLISTIPTLDTSKYVKTHSRLLSGSAPRPASRTYMAHPRSVPQPRVMRARSLCSQCATPCSTWTASYTRAQRPPMQGCLYSLCVLALRSTSHATRPPAARAEVCGEVGVTISPRASTRGCY